MADLGFTYVSKGVSGAVYRSGDTAIKKSLYSIDSAEHEYRVAKLLEERGVGGFVRHRSIAHGTIYMDWVEGKDWEQFSSRATKEESAHYAQEAATALGGALKAGVIPYDLHGKNFIVSPEKRELTFIDFGSYAIFNPPSPPSLISDSIAQLFSCFKSCYSDGVSAKGVWINMGMCLEDIIDHPDIIRSVANTRSKLTEEGMNHHNYQTILNGLEEIRAICEKIALSSNSC